MSYNLFLTFPAPQSRAVLNQWFAQRQYYRVGDVIGYENPETGVYFTYEVRTADSDADSILGLALNLDYYRPSFFGFEAEIEVGAFVQHFSPRIDAPPSYGMAKGIYSAEGFLRGWNAGNQAAYDAADTQKLGHSSFPLPTEILISIWRWNHQRNTIATRFGGRTFIPRIMTVSLRGTPCTMALWLDSEPILLPETDCTLISRIHQQDHCLVMKADLDRVLPPLTNEGWPRLARILPQYTPPPAEHERSGGFWSFMQPSPPGPPPSPVKQWINSLQPFRLNQNLRMISSDSLLDQEMVDLARARSPKVLTPA